MVNPRSIHVGPSRGFTLIELLVVIGIITTLAVLTAVSVTRLSRDSRLAIGTNQVIAALGEARARAMKENQPVLITFRARAVDPLVPARGQVTDVVIALWSGMVVKVVDGGPNNPVVDVWNMPFNAHPEAVTRTLPPGVKVAGPRTDFDQDSIWVSQPEFSNNEYGRAIGVLFGPDGTVITRFPNGIGLANYESVYFDFDGVKNANGWPVQNVGTSTGAARFFEYNEEVDEPSIQYVRSLAVFDDAAAREFFVVSNWSGSNQAPGDASGAALPADCSSLPAGQSRLRCEQSQFINQFAEKINFNRFTGVAEVVKR
ncbi:MAG: prepilin-type N-terminal cleavage/methylation domain-containing protein [Phycisphaeraceae bacterium]|nr:prepilin-type N-terminal cleavage/methylation domain-containing protein [Phycisphaeraceae bacterium]